MKDIAYYPLTNEIIYRGFYQYGIEEGEQYNGLNREQLKTLEDEIFSYLDYIFIKYIISGMDTDYSFMKLTLKEVKISVVDDMKIGTSPDLLLIFAPNKIPTIDFLENFREALKDQLEGDVYEGHNYKLPNLDFEVLIG